MKAPLFVDENTRRRLALSGYFAASTGVLSDDEVRWLVQNENRVHIPNLLIMAHRLGRDQRLVLGDPGNLGSPRITIPSELAQEQEAFWTAEYGVKANFSGLQIPTPPIGFKARFLVMHEKFATSPEALFQSDESAYGGKVWKFTDSNLDEVVPTHKHIGTFGFWVADVQEALDGCVGGINLNTQAVEELGWVTQTLPMRQVHGRRHFRQHGRHLDQKVVTLCPGSRAADAHVPSVGLSDGGGVNVDTWHLAGANDSLRFRRVIL